MPPIHLPYHQTRQLQDVPQTVVLLLTHRFRTLLQKIFVPLVIQNQSHLTIRDCAFHLTLKGPVTMEGASSSTSAGFASQQTIPDLTVPKWTPSENVLSSSSSVFVNNFTPHNSGVCVSEGPFTDFSEFNSGCVENTVNLEVASQTNDNILPASDSDSGTLLDNSGLFECFNILPDEISDSSIPWFLFSDTDLNANDYLYSNLGTRPLNADLEYDSDLIVEFRPLPQDISAPLNTNLFETLLESYPDRVAVDFLLHGFVHGFDLGFRGDIISTRPPNLRSALNNRQSVTSAIYSEVQRGHTAGPFRTAPFTTSHCSPLGAVPKSDGSIRIILDLSSPRGTSVNNGIPVGTFSVTYARFDDAVEILRSLGAGCYLAKADIKHAFRNLPVREADWPLLCYEWEGYFYVDLRLPFGGRSSPYLFNTFAKVLAWILVNILAIAFIVQYLDDFLIISRSFQGCKEDLDSMLNLCHGLNLPINFKKVFGPSQKMIFLGIEIDTQNMTLSLPADKLSDLKRALLTFRNRKKCTKRELLSLIGRLSFATKIIRPGRLFLRRLIDLSTTVKQLNHYIYLNKEAKKDIDWWEQFLDQWSGTSIIPEAPIPAEKISLYTDASSLGFGAYYGTHWFSQAWPKKYQAPHIDISYRELFAVTTAVFTWVALLRNKHVILYSDNMAVVRAWHSGSCKDKNLMSLIRPLFLFCASNSITLSLKHVPGKKNVLADLLSRLQVLKFRQKYPQADLAPSLIHPGVWTL